METAIGITTGLRVLSKVPAGDLRKMIAGKIQALRDTGRPGDTYTLHFFDADIRFTRAPDGGLTQRLILRNSKVLECPACKTLHRSPPALRRCFEKCCRRMGGEPNLAALT